MASKTRHQNKRMSFAQRKKLSEFMIKHPELKRPNNHKDAQIMWQQLASECNALPGSRKSWRLWRKTWHDLCFKAKVRKAKSIGVPPSKVTLSLEEDIVNNTAASTTQQKAPEFVNIDHKMKLENFNIEDNFNNVSFSEPESPPEQKVFVQSHKINRIKNDEKREEKRCDDSFLNCELIAINEKRKLNIQEDYYNIKKDYLRQKLKLMKERTDALKTIASAISDLE